MQTITFALNNRVKHILDECVESAYEKFLNDFGEALDELHRVHIWKGLKCVKTFEAHEFRKQYRHIEDKVGDDVTEKMMKGGA